LTKFSRNWLQLREPLDKASRSQKISKTLRLVRPQRPIHVMDLATGTGANLRYLCKELGGHQIWHLIDHDKNLLEAIPSYTKDWAAKNKLLVNEIENKFLIKGNNIDCHIYTQQKDLSDPNKISIPEKALVSGSALLDLVSINWLESLAKKCVRIKATILFSLNYDGHIKLKPYEQEDELVRALVNKHQVTNKGFGEAMGPTAGYNAIKIFSELGYNIKNHRSDWHIKSNDQELQTMLLDTWLEAAIEIAPQQTKKLKNWRERRQSHIFSKNSELTVGHTDILGWVSE